MAKKLSSSIKYRKRQLAQNIESVKYREVLVDTNWARPNINPLKLFDAVGYIGKTYVSVTPPLLMLLITLERFQFFTLKYVYSTNPNRIEDERTCETRLYQMVMKLQLQGFIYSVIRSWELDDKEYKQRYGDDKNRHNYRKRYAVTAAGKLLLDRFYSIAGVENIEP